MIIIDSINNLLHKSENNEVDQSRHLVTAKKEIFGVD